MRLDVGFCLLSKILMDFVGDWYYLERQKHRIRRLVFISSHLLRMGAAHMLASHVSNADAAEDDDK